MTPDQERMLRETRDSSIRTEEQLKVILDRQQSHADRLSKLERWHWTLHGTWGAIAGAIVVFKDKIVGMIQ
jgi:hypothetical protein